MTSANVPYNGWIRALESIRDSFPDLRTIEMMAEPPNFRPWGIDVRAAWYRMLEDRYFKEIKSLQKVVVTFEFLTFGFGMMGLGRTMRF